MRERQRQQNIFYSLLFLVSVFIIILSEPIAIYAQGLETLAGKVSQGILDYFIAKKESNIRFAIIKFENFSGLSDLTVHKFYQHLAANLEGGRPHILFNDLMIDFNHKKGEFNINRIDRLDYLIYLKLIKRLSKVGVGVAVFSRSLDKITYIKYFEEDFSAGERDIYETLDYGFKGSGFSRQVEIEADKNLLDFKSIDNSIGAGSDADRGQYFFFYPGKIEIFKTRDNQFKKFLTIKLEWGRPYYPVMNYEGRLCFFYGGNETGGPWLYLTAGGNFSPKAKILTFQNNQWQEIDSLNFIPLKAIRLNNDNYMAGGIYDEGKNYFKDNLILVPFVDGKLAVENRLEKKVVPFYSLDFSTLTQQPRDASESTGNVAGVHVIDTDYNYRFYAGDFQEQPAALEKRGSALAALNGQWLAVSEYSLSAQKDKLYFYKIEEGSKQPVYENPINGQIIFISAGSWQNQQGFWVYVEESKNDNFSYRLQFWSKNIDNEEETIKG